ncbi:MAG: DJ-1/PfpI family protein [Tissierellia bacterium]|nr:DJ-1/PfpI family protein [Tissierellia bacterium]
MKDLLVFVANGFEEVEALTVVDYCRRAGLEVDLVSVTDRKEVRGAHGVTVIADELLDNVSIKDYAGVYIPGGQPGATNLMKEKRVVEIVEIMKEQEKIVGAICAGPQVLDAARIIESGKFTCYPGVEQRLEVKDPLDLPVYREENVITAMGPALAICMAEKMVEALADEEKAKEISEEFLVPKLRQFIKEDIF